MVSIGRVIESFRNTVESVGRSGLIHGLTAEGAAESASIGGRAARAASAGSKAAREEARAAVNAAKKAEAAAPLNHLAEDATIRAGKSPVYAQATDRAKSAYRGVIDSNRSAMDSARKEAYDRAYRMTKIRNRAVIGFGGLAVANGGAKTRNNQSTFAATGMRRGGIGHSSGAMQRLDYGNRSSGAYA